MSPSLLGTKLDGEVVLLELGQARLYHLDSWAQRVWSACNGRDTDALAAVLQAPVERVTETLLSLADADIVRKDARGWVQAPVTWV